MAKTTATTKINGIEVTTVRGIKSFVSDWFAGKNGIAVENHRVLAILKETEKAVYAIYGNKFGEKKTLWIPKSLIVEEPANYDDYWSYVVTGDWNTAMNEIKLEASMWR